MRNRSSPQTPAFISGDQSKSSELEQILDSNLGSGHSKSSFSVTDFDLSFLTTPNPTVNGPSTTVTTHSSTSAPSNGFNNAATTSSATASSPSSAPNGSSEEHPYRCGRCSYSSKNLNDLKQHFGSHVGEALKAPLKCTKCNFSCHESAQLRDHFQSIHAKKPNHDTC